MGRAARKTHQKDPSAGSRLRRGALAETSDELDPKTADDEDAGSLRRRRLRKDNLLKEVELDWEASSLIETQELAYAHPKDFPKLEGDYVLPKTYGRDRLVLMARDPRWIYAYWEIGNERRLQQRGERARDWDRSKPVLRLYDVTESRYPGHHIDIDLVPDADNWYLRAPRPNRRYVAEIGRAFPDGFVSYLRSNEIALPPEYPSMEMAEEWASLDWDASYGRFITKVGVSSKGPWGHEFGK